MANRAHTTAAPISEPNSGRRMTRVTRLIGASRSSSACGAEGAGGVNGDGVMALMVSVASVEAPCGHQPARRARHAVPGYSSPAVIAAETLEMLLLSTSSGPLAT